MVKGLQDAVGILDDFRDAATSGSGLKGRAARAMCDAYADNPVAGAMISASNQPFGVGMRYGCGPYWQGPDGYTPPTAPTEEPQFSGGQCPGVSYRVFRESSSSSVSEQQVTNPSTYQGPISSAFTKTGEDDRQFRCFTYGPNQTEKCYQGSAPGGELDPVLNITRVERVDGNPDDCGDPPPEYVPPQPGSPPPGRGYGDPRDIGEPGEPYIITPRPPVIGPDGQPTVPVDTPTGPVDFRPDGTDPAPGGEPSIGEPIDVDGSGEVDEDPDDELTKPSLLGYRFTVRDSAPQFQSVIPGTSPRIYSRVVGSLQLILRGENGTFYSDNLQITSQEGSIVKSHPTLKVVGCVYNVLPNLTGLTLREIRGKDDDS